MQSKSEGSKSWNLSDQVKRLVWINWSNSKLTPLISPHVKRSPSKEIFSQLFPTYVVKPKQQKPEIHFVIGLISQSSRCSVYVKSNVQMDWIVKWNFPSHQCLIFVLSSPWNHHHLCEFTIIAASQSSQILFLSWVMHSRWRPEEQIFFWGGGLFFAFSRAAPSAYGGSQARGLISAVAAGLHHSHSNGGFEQHLQPTPQLTEMPDP